MITPRFGLESGRSKGRVVNTKPGRVVNTKPGRVVNTKPGRWKSPGDTLMRTVTGDTLMRTVTGDTLLRTATSHGFLASSLTCFSEAVKQQRLGFVQAMSVFVSQHMSSRRVRVRIQI